MTEAKNRRAAVVIGPLAPTGVLGRKHPLIKGMAPKEGGQPWRWKGLRNRAPLIPVILNVMVVVGPGPSCPETRVVAHVLPFVHPLKEGPRALQTVAGGVVFVVQPLGFGGDKRLPSPFNGFMTGTLEVAFRLQGAGVLKRTAQGI